MGGRGRPYLSRQKNTLFAPPGTGNTENGHGMCHVAAKICERVLENDTDQPKTGQKKAGNSLEEKEEHFN